MMATLEIDTQPRLLPALPMTASPFRHVRRRRKRLALISTRSDLCGIAAYTRSLEKQLGDVFESQYSTWINICCAARMAASKNLVTGTFSIFVAR
jgi:hypothetical protein